MHQEDYKVCEMTTDRFLKQTIFNWIFILGYTYVLWIFVPKIRTENVFGIVMVFCMLGIICIPALWITINYLIHSRNRKIIVSNEGISVINKKTGKKNWIDKKRFQHVHYYTNDFGSNRLPWSFMEHLIITVEGRPPVVITSFQTSIMEIWLNSISNDIFRDAKQHRKESIYQPINLSKIEQSQF